MWIALLPFMNPITCATEYFGGIDSSIGTWSIIRCPSWISHSRCRANSRNTLPRCRRNCPYSLFASILRNEDDVIFTFPLAVVKTFIFLHDLSFPWLTLSGSPHGASMDSRSCQTLGVSPAQPEGFPI